MGNDGVWGWVSGCCCRWRGGGGAGREKRVAAAKVGLWSGGWVVVEEKRRKKEKEKEEGKWDRNVGGSGALYMGVGGGVCEKKKSGAKKKETGKGRGWGNLLLKLFEDRRRRSRYRVRQGV